MRRLSCALLLLALLPFPTPAGAQPAEGEVDLRLLEHTPWNSPARERLTFDLRFEAMNRGQTPVDGLSLAFTMFARSEGRFSYEDSLTRDPGAPIEFVRRDLAGAIDPGQTRAFRIRRSLEVLVDRTPEPGAVYPAKVELRSNDVVLAALRAPIVFLTGEQELPLALTATVVLDDRVRVDPAGTFVDNGLAQRLAPDGDLAAAAEVLQEPPVPVNLALSPLLVEQLVDMADGYRLRRGATAVDVPADAESASAARDVLDAFEDALAGEDVELPAYPYAQPSLPALARGGLDEDVRAQIRKGGDVVEQALGRRPDESVVRPPLGAIDSASLEELQPAAGVRTILLDDRAAEPPVEPLAFTPVATGTIVVEGERTLPGILPNESVHALLDSLPGDPVLRAQATLGELAAIYLEQPGLDRGVALLFDERRPADAAFLGPFLEAIGTAPFLRPLTASEFLQAERPAADLTFDDRVHPTFSLSYESAIRDARRAIDKLRAMLVEQTPLAGRLTALVFLAEARQFVEDEPAGRVYLRRVTDEVRREFRKIEPPRQGETFTLASRRGSLPLTIRNLTGRRVKIVVALRSSALRFAGGGSQEVVLEDELATFFFPVQAQRGGRFPVDVVLCTPRPAGCAPDAAAAVATSQIIVRSTVYNRVALVITIGAALFLLFWWGRRWLRRPS